MTVILHKVQSDNRIVSHCDSITTYEGLPDEPLKNRSSKNEIFLPKSGYFYKEDRCKFGLISDSCYFSITGDYYVALTLLSPIIDILKQHPTIERIKSLLYQSCQSVSIQNGYVEIHWCLFQNGNITLFKTSFIYTSGKLFKSKLDTADLQKGEIYMGGNGVELFKEYDPYLVNKLLSEEPQMEKYLISILAHEYSNFLYSKRDISLKDGYGGSFLGIQIGMNGIEFGKSAIYLMSIDEKIKYLTKTIYSDSYALVINYLDGLITYMPYIDHDIFTRMNPQHHTQERVNKLREKVLSFSKFDSQITLLDSRTSDNPYAANVGIIENDDESVVGGFSTNVELEHDIPVFFPGSSITLMLSDGSTRTFSFTE